jgi:predicted CopG family antitoxin
MRTTLTIDEDVAAELARLRKTDDRSFKDLVNEALRQGLKVMIHPPKKRRPFRTMTVDAGECLIGSLDNVAEVISLVEGEDHR